MNALIVPTIEPSDDGTLRVSSETIAKGAGVQHKNVLELIAKYETRLERFGTLAFETRRSGGTPTRVALLNEQQATALMMLMKNTEKVLDFKFALTDAFFSMAQQLATAPALTNDQIVQQALQITHSRVLELEAKAEEDAPKVAYWDRFTADNDYHLIRTVASVLDVGEWELRDALVWGGWIYVDNQKRRNSKGEIVTEYQWAEYAEKKPYFHRSMNHQAPSFKGNVAFTLKATTPGAAAIARFVERQTVKHGSWQDALSALETAYIEKKNKEVAA